MDHNFFNIYQVVETARFLKTADYWISGIIRVSVGCLPGCQKVDAGTGTGSGRSRISLSVVVGRGNLSQCVWPRQEIRVKEYVSFNKDKSFYVSVIIFYFIKTLMEVIRRSGINAWSKELQRK